MVFLLTTVDETGLIREFSCHLDKLEDGFDFLNGMVTEGYALLKVCVLDQGQFIQLPVEAFDGVAVSTTLQQLEQEWNAILAASPQTGTVTNQAYIDWLTRKLRQYDQRIADYRSTLSRLDALLRRARELRKEKDGDNDVLHHYDSLITSFDSRLIKAGLLRQQLHQRLQELLNR